MKRTLVAVVVVLIAVIGITAYVLRDRHTDQAARNITIGTFSKALGNSPYHIAKHFDWFKSEKGLTHATITYKEFGDRPTISNAFTSGDLDVLYSAEVPSILCRAQGNDTRIVAVSATVAQGILVRSDLSISTIPDLRGRSLAILQGTSSHFGLLKILRANGLAEQDLDLRFMSPPEAKMAFETDKLDAWAVWSPFVEQQEVSGKGKLIAGGDATIDSVMTVSTRLLQEDEEAVRGIVAAIDRAKRWIEANPDEAIKIAAAELNLDPAVVARAWPKHNWGATLNEAIISDIQEKASFLAAEDKTRASKDLNVRTELIDTRFVSK